MGAEIPVANMDVTVGGKRHICMAMETPNGPMKMWFVGEFLEVTPTTRLVYTDAMSDEDGNVMTPEQMGMPEGHPATTEVVVELEDMGSSTKMTMTHVGALRTHRVRPDGAWPSTSLKPTPHHRASQRVCFGRTPNEPALTDPAFDFFDGFEAVGADRVD